MPQPLRHSQETHAHVMGVYRRLLTNEEAASNAPRRRPPVTLQSLLAAADKFDRQLLSAPQPVSLPTAPVQACIRFFAETSAERIHEFFTSSQARDLALDVFALSPAEILKRRFDDDAHRWLSLGAALWYARRAFEWVHEPSTEGLLGHVTAYRHLTVQAIALSLRYQVRDGFQPFAFLPRDPSMVDAFSSTEQKDLYLQWSVDYDTRSRLVLGGADHWGWFNR